MIKTERYTINPDVSCREEGPEGALLFNPDTGNMLVINPTGLLIWQILFQTRTIEEIVSCLEAACDGVPHDRVTGEVGEFVQQMLPGGFIGKIIENDDN